MNNTPERLAALRAIFAQFWALYPKKVGKDAALSAWKRKVKGDHMEVIDSLKTQKTQEAWAKEGGRFVPNPATWLNQGRWKDEVGQGGECSAVADWTPRGLCAFWHHSRARLGSAARTAGKSHRPARSTRDDQRTRHARHHTDPG